MWLQIQVIVVCYFHISLLFNEQRNSEPIKYHIHGKINKKLCYRRWTVWCNVSVKILLTAAKQCRNNFNDKSRVKQSNGVRGLQPTCIINLCIQPWRAHHRRCNAQADHQRVCWLHQYTDNLLWQNFLSPKCRNYSRDPDHAHSGDSRSSQG